MTVDLALDLTLEDTRARDVPFFWTTNPEASVEAERVRALPNVLTFREAVCSAFAADALSFCAFADGNCAWANAPTLSSNDRPK